MSSTSPESGRIIDGRDTTNPIPWERLNLQDMAFSAFTGDQFVKESRTDKLFFVYNGETLHLRGHKQLSKVGIRKDKMDVYFRVYDTHNKEIVYISFWYNTDKDEEIVDKDVDSAVEKVEEGCYSGLGTLLYKKLIGYYSTLGKNGVHFNHRITQDLSLGLTEEQWDSKFGDIVDNYKYTGVQGGKKVWQKQY